MSEGEERVLCPNCGQSFNRKYIHCHRKNRCCKEGSVKRNSNASNVADGKENSASAEVHRCPEEGCTSAYHQLRSLRRHLREKHQKSSEESLSWATAVKCARCDSAFHSIVDLCGHVRSSPDHWDSEGQFSSQQSALFESNQQKCSLPGKRRPSASLANSLSSARLKGRARVGWTNTGAIGLAKVELPHTKRPISCQAREPLVEHLAAKRAFIALPS